MVHRESIGTLESLWKIATIIFFISYYNLSNIINSFAVTPSPSGSQQSLLMLGPGSGAQGIVSLISFFT